MNATIGLTVLIFIVVALIIATAGEFGKGGNAVKSIVTLAVLAAISGYIAALAGGA